VPNPNRRSRDYVIFEESGNYAKNKLILDEWCRERRTSNKKTTKPLNLDRKNILLDFSGEEKWKAVRNN
jgi:hypothetical protein